MLRIPRIVRRVVVAVAHAQARARGQRHRCREAIRILPVEVPLRDHQQSFARPIREHCITLQALAQVVRVRLDRQQIHGHREDGRFFNRVMSRPRRDVDPVGAQVNLHRRIGRRDICEVEADARLHRLRFAQRLHVDQHDQVRARRQSPRQSLGRLVRRCARLPACEVTARILDEGWNIHPRETRTSVLRVQTPAFLCAIESDEHMMHRFAPGAKLHGAHILLGRRRHRDHEVAIHIGAIRRQRIRLGQRQRHIRRTKLPALGPLRMRRRISRALHRAFTGPLLNHAELRRGEVPLLKKLLVPILRQPRWHQTLLRHLRDLGRPLLCVRVRDEMEWTRLTGPVARGAVLVENGRNVLVKGNLPARSRHIRVAGWRHHAAAPHQRSHTQRSHTEHHAKQHRHADVETHSPAVRFRRLSSLPRLCMFLRRHLSKFKSTRNYET